jgi:hypothetical protein
MSFKKITKKEWIKLGLPEAPMTIHVGPYYEWDFEKKDFKKPKLIVTQEVKKSKKEEK